MLMRIRCISLSIPVPLALDTVRSKRTTFWHRPRLCLAGWKVTRIIISLGFGLLVAKLGVGPLSLFLLIVINNELPQQKRRERRITGTGWNRYDGRGRKLSGGKPRPQSLIWGNTWLVYYCILNRLWSPLEKRIYPPPLPAMCKHVLEISIFFLQPDLSSALEAAGS